MSIDKRCCLLKNAKAFAKKGEKEVRLKKIGHKALNISIFKTCGR